MSSYPSSPLATRFASLHTASQADAARSWLPATLQTLIMSILARIFGRLEQLLLLWQSGQLPPFEAAHPGPAPAPRPEIAIAPRHPAQPHARRTRIRAPIRDLAARVVIARRVPVPHARAQKPGITSSRAITPSSRPRPAHDPPAAQSAANPPLARSHNRIQIVTTTK